MPKDSVHIKLPLCQIKIDVVSILRDLPNHSDPAGALVTMIRRAVGDARVNGAAIGWNLGFKAASSAMAAQPIPVVTVTGQVVTVADSKARRRIARKTAKK